MIRGLRGFAVVLLEGVDEFRKIVRAFVGSRGEDRPGGSPELEHAAANRDLPPRRSGRARLAGR
jgi:hypothetical protein